MTIQDLLRAAHAIDPKVEYVIYDTFQYTHDKVLRSTRASASSVGRAGSDEDIEIQFLPRNRDIVANIVPGETTRFWQLDPLMRAFRESANVAAPTPEIQQLVGVPRA